MERSHSRGLRFKMSATYEIPWAKPDYWGKEEKYVLEAVL
jgi:hypothetical protein